MASYSSAITIEELDGDQKPLRVLTLKGSGLPFQGAPWGTESVVPTTWYPNNPDEATQQVLVTKELPTTWEGRWHLTMLLRGPCSLQDPSGLAGVGPQEAADVTSPGLLVDTLDDMQRRGRLLRVTWVTDSDNPALARTIRRLGRLVRFVAKYKHSDRVDWEAEWSWKSRGATQSRVTSTRSDNVPSAATALQAAANAAIAASETVIQSALAGVRSSATQFTLGQLEAFAQAPLTVTKTFLNSLGQIVNRFSQVAAIAQGISTLPDEIANAAVDFARDTVDQVNQFRETLGETPAEQMTLSDNVADLLRSTRYYGQIDDQADVCAQRAVDLRAQLKRALTTNPGGPRSSAADTTSANPQTILDVRLVRAGDTPQTLSRTYYGTVDHDVDILRCNRLPWHLTTLAVGSIVVIPALPSTRSS